MGMSSGAAQTWFIVGTIPLMLAGGAHVLATVLDVARPTFFTPIGIHDFDLVGQIGGLRALTIAVPAAYLAISLVFWFYATNLIGAAATACFIVSAVLAA